MKVEHQWETPPVDEECASCFKDLNGPAIRRAILSLGREVDTEWTCSEECWEHLARLDYYNGGPGDW